MPRPTSLWLGTCRSSSSMKRTLPVRLRSSPATVFSVVDLPAPLAPISVTTSPCSTWKDTSFTAWMLP